MAFPYVPYDWSLGDVLTEARMDNLETQFQSIIDLLTTHGDIAYRGAATWERLAKGTQGYFLQQGANDPIWVVNASAGAHRARAYGNAAQSIDHNTLTTIVLDVEDFDPSGEFAANGYTATVAGTYLLIGQVHLNSIGDGKTLTTYIKVDGATVAMNVDYPGANTNYAGKPVATMEELAIGEKVTLACIHNEGVARDTRNGRINTFLAVHLLSA